jgi:hypothetical protein
VIIQFMTLNIIHTDETIHTETRIKSSGIVLLFELNREGCAAGRVVSTFELNQEGGAAGHVVSSIQSNCQGSGAGRVALTETTPPAARDHSIYDIEYNSHRRDHSYKDPDKDTCCIIL